MKCSYCQETYVSSHHTTRELNFVTKWNTLRNTLTGMPLKICPSFQQAARFPGDIHNQCLRTEWHHFSLHNFVESSKLFNDAVTKLRFSHQMVYGIFSTLSAKIPKLYSTSLRAPVNLWLHTFQRVKFLYWGTGKSLVRPGEKQATATTDSHSKINSEGCPSNQVSAAAMTSASDEKLRPFNFFSVGSG